MKKKKRMHFLSCLRDLSHFVPQSKGVICSPDTIGTFEIRGSLSCLKALIKNVDIFCLGEFLYNVSLLNMKDKIININGKQLSDINGSLSSAEVFFFYLLMKL